jgi:hypothetical protein
MSLMSLSEMVKKHLHRRTGVWLSIYMIDRVLDGCIGLVCLVVLLFFPKGVDEINVSFCVYLQGGSVMLD